MNNTFKKLLSVILCAVLLFTTASVAFAADEETRTVVDSGFCGAQGENLTWTLYSDGELVISGEGEMQWYYVDYNDKEPDVDVPPPWYDYYPVIDVITFEEGVTGIGNAAFSGEYNRFRRVNFPKSLEYFDGEFYWDEKTCDQGRCIVVCYAGTEEEWNQVERRTYSYSLNSEKNGYNRKNKTVTKGYKFDRLLKDVNRVVLYYNGESPEAFAKIEISSLGQSTKLTENVRKKQLKVFYYPGDNKDVELVWKIDGDSIEFTEFIEDTGSTNNIIEVKIEALRYGESEVMVELVDKDGNVLSSDNIAVKSTIPVDMNIFEKLHYYGLEGVGAIGGAWLYSTFAFFVYIEWLIIDPIGAFKALGDEITKLFK